MPIEFHILPEQTRTEAEQHKIDLEYPVHTALKHVLSDLTKKYGYLKVSTDLYDIAYQLQRMEKD